MLSQEQEAALQRLLAIAQSDTGQSRKCADFLLAWWNAASCGGWDPVDLWAVDHQIADDMLCVLAAIREVSSYPDAIGYKPQFQQLIEMWRPHLGVAEKPAVEQ